MRDGKMALLRLGPWVVLIAFLGLAWLLVRLAGPQATGSFVTEWYMVLSRVYLAAGIPLNDMARGLNIPLVSALALGLVGALSPCQLSTGAAALAYLAPRTAQPQEFSASLGAYIAGKVFTYSLMAVRWCWRVSRSTTPSRWSRRCARRSVR